MTDIRFEASGIDIEKMKERYTNKDDSRPYRNRKVKRVKE